MDLDFGANLKLNTDLIPDDLMPLVPFVERWGFESLDDQDQFALAMIRERPDEVEQFNNIVDKYDDRVREWSSTLSNLKRHKDDMTEEDWEHPYWAFLSVFKIREITGRDDDDDPELQALREKLAEEWRLEKYREAVIIADAAFRERKYADYVAALRDYQDLFSPAQSKKHAIAVKRAN